MVYKSKKFVIILITILISGSFLFSQNAIAANPKLSIYPQNYNFGDRLEGFTDSLIFSIWNSGGCSCGTLYYTLDESCDWLNVQPISGSSTGEIDQIEVTIDTDGLSKGYNSYDILIESNDVNSFFTVTVNIIDKTNNPPNAPTIEGKLEGKAGEEQNYILSAIDPDGDDVSYCINWDDNTGEICIGPFPSGVDQTVTQTWSEEGTYTIQVKAQDIHGAESEWTELEVSMPKARVFIFHLFFQRLIENYPHLFPILREILEL